MPEPTVKRTEKDVTRDIARIERKRKKVYDVLNKLDDQLIGLHREWEDFIRRDMESTEARIAEQDKIIAEIDARRAAR
jgi:chemotaxis regulatin CheY-phosphate phosphatase CheZ